MRAVVGLNGFDLHVELPGFVFIFRVAGRVEGVLFGMLTETIKLRRQRPGSRKENQIIDLVRTAWKGYRSHWPPVGCRNPLRPREERSDRRSRTNRYNRLQMHQFNTFIASVVHQLKHS